MKTMLCKQLGGGCEQKLRGNSFEEIAEQSRQHCTKMLEQNDQAHLAAMAEMETLMQEPQAMSDWFDSKRAEFSALADD
ncbi:MAG: hypothetical protein ACPG52_02130 [Cognaticolwellia sp.]